MIKNFYITKNKFKKTENQPDYKISFKDEKDNFVDLGGAWLKEGKAGKFFSCALGNAWKDHTNESNSRKGFHIEEDKVEKLEIEDDSNDPEDMPF